MVLYHQNRIELSYIPRLRASFKAYDAVPSRNDADAPENRSVSDPTLSFLRTLLFDCNIKGTSTFERHARLVIASYNLRRTKNIEEELYSSRGATSISKSLWSDICLLARLRVAFQTFKNIALMLPSFEKVTIILVPCPLAPANQSQRPLNLKQAFGILQLDLGAATIKDVLGRNWTVPRIEREFAKRQKQKPNVHAEVQMLMSLNTNEPYTSGLFPYLGCSKLSCFMCNCFLRSYGRFTTRGCHGRLFKSWTVPSVDRLPPGQADQIAEALILVQTEVEMKLKASVEGYVRHERTSVVGGSSVLGGRQEERSQRQLQIDQLRIKTERERVAEMFKRQTENTTNPVRRTSSILEGDELDRECSICMRPTKRRCGICSQDFFCSDPCQEKRSGSHLFKCSKRPLTSADYLWKSLAEDLLPQDEDVLEDFGFNQLFGGDLTYLFGVYQGLYLSGGFSAEDIHEWRVQGILVDKIKQFYYRIPENARGEYFPWFLKNLHVLERPMTKDEAQQRLVATFYDKARPYLNIEDRNKTAKELKPKAKGASYNLLAEILLRFSPHPTEENWYSFGFVTCHGKSQESMLIDLYLLLLTESDGSFFYKFHNSRRNVIQPVTFTQFWKAYEAGTIIQLMDSKGLKELRSWLPFLEGFLSVPPAGPHPSVWSLKQFLEIDDPMDHPPVPSVNVDYGFMNCHTFEDTCILMEIYKKILKTASPLDLHQACVAGDLFRFASGYFLMKEHWRPLMRNFYPLKEVVELELRSDVRSDVRSEVVPEVVPEVVVPKVRSEIRTNVDPVAGKDPAGPPSLLSRLWAFIGGVPY
ncbi:MAG: hypothetical protein Q9195_000585 [Heterodermia aff. obscurata]